MYDGTLKFNTSMNTSGFQKGLSKLGSIVGGLTVFDVLKKGFDMITESVDAAMGRLDTMDQFSRVMTTMTGSVDTANAALAETNEIVTGTAYGLDTASKGVQAFVASGMKVQAATDTMAAWADATSFYTQGTNAELGTVSAALQKMQTKGTVSMEHLQMLLEAGIPAVQIYADAVGISTDEVTDAMGRGELKTDDFISVMNEAFETGTAGFPSVAGAAKQAGASWSGSIDNMKAAIARGTASILTSFDDIFNVKSGMVTFGKTIEKAMKGIADNLGVIVPTAIAATAALITLKVASSISSSFKALSTAITAAVQQVSALAAGSTAAASAITFQTVAQKALTGAVALGNVVKAVATTIALVMTGATWAEAAATAGLSGAWTALNAVIFASPLGWILLAIVGVTAAIAGIVSAVQSANKEYYAEKDALKELEEEHDDYADALRESKDAAQEEAQEKIVQVQNNRDLLNSLAELVDENGNVVGSTDEVRSTVSELNGNLEDLGLAYDETSGKINMTSEELRDYGDALEAVTKYESAQDEYNNILKERTSLQAKINTLEAKKEAYNKMLQEGTISERQYNKLIKEANELLDDYSDSMGELEIEVGAYKIAAEDAYDAEAEISVKRQEIANEQMDAVEEYADKYHITTDQVLDEASRMEGGLEEWADAAEETYAHVLVAEQDYVDEIKAGNIEINASYAESLEARRLNGEELNNIEQTYLDQWKEMNQKAVDYYRGQQQEIIDASKSKSDEIILSEQRSADEVLRIQRENNEATSAFVDNYNLIWGKIPVSQRQYLAEMTIDDARFLDEMASTWDEGGREQWEQYASGIQESIDISGQQVQGSAEEYGEGITGATATGMEGASEEISAAADNAANIYGSAISESTAPDEASQQVVNQVANNFATADYSGVTTGIATAIEMGSGGVDTAVESLSSNIVAKVSTLSTAVKLLTTLMMTKATAAILSGKETVIAAVELLSDGVTDKFGFMAMQASSIVDNMMRGMIIGMDNWAPKLYAKADAIAAEIVRRIRAAFEEHSPSRVMIDIFGNVMKGMIIGMDNEEDSLYSTVDNLTGGILSRFGSLKGIDLGSLQVELGNAVAATRSGITSTAATYNRSTNTSTSQTTTNNNSPTFVINNDVDVGLAIRKYDRMLASKLRGS